MIAHLRGRLLSKTPQTAVVEAGGVGYELTISIPRSLRCRRWRSCAAGLYPCSRGCAGAVWIYYPDREAAVRKAAVDQRNRPKLAITVFSGLPPERLIAAIHGQDHATLTHIPGVGKKTAETDCAGAERQIAGAGACRRNRPSTPVSEDVLSALVNLGYQRAAAQKGIEAAIARSRRPARISKHSFAPLWPR